MTNKNIVEINGKKYDTHTGAVLSDVVPTQSLSPQKVRIISDVKPLHTSAQSAAYRAHTLHQNQSKGQTLKRELVRKPDYTESHTAEEPLVPPSVFSTPPHVRVTTADQERLERAQQVLQSSKISRFGKAHEMQVHKQHQVLDVVEAPKPHHATSTRHHDKTSSTQTQQHNTHHVAHYKAHNANHAGTYNHVKTVHHQKERLRHRIKNKLSRHSYATGVVTAGVAALLFGGFFAYQYSPQASLRIAENRAGINARLPRSLPGYAMDKTIHYSSGQITLSFYSNSDNRSYTVAERASNWNSEALRLNFVVNRSLSYESVLDRGRTIFLYDKGKATWVDGGLWYEIDGNEHMSRNQLLELIASL